MPTRNIYANIDESLRSLEARLLELEDNQSDMALRVAVVDSMGLVTLKNLGGVCSDLLDGFADGSIQPDTDVMDSFFALAESLKHLLYALAVKAGSHIETTKDAEAHDQAQDSAEIEAEAPQANVSKEQKPPLNAPLKDQLKSTAIIKVNTTKLDDLMEAVKELVITQTMISQFPIATGESGKALHETILEQERVVNSIRHHVLDIRKVCLTPTFSRMERLVRDLGVKTGKAVELVMEGAETEIDKSLADDLADPLLHLVRNAVDHGIESLEERSVSGKPEVGRVTLKAYRRQSSIFLEVVDDGKGLDKNAILAKAKEKGLASDSEGLDERAVYSLIMSPGFSTASSVTDISGRGVGMDVVARAIRELDGELEIQSRKGEGSSFIIRLPSHRSSMEGIANGIVVKVAGGTYVIPSSSVLEVLQPAHDDLSTVAGQGEIIHIRGKVYPLFRMDCIFNVAASCISPTDGLVLLVETGGQRRALLTDDVLGERQVVIRPFTGFEKFIGGNMFSGIALIGDTIGIAVDLDHFFASSEQDNRLCVCRLKIQGC